MTTDDLVRINKDYFTKAGDIAIKTAMLSAFPFLTIQPFNLLLEQAVNWIMNKLADGLELSAFFEYIDMRSSQQGKDYVDAAHKANTTQLEQDIKDADLKFKSLIKFSN